MTARHWLVDQLHAIGHEASIDGIANVYGRSRTTDLGAAQRAAAKSIRCGEVPFGIHSRSALRWYKPAESERDGISGPRTRFLPELMIGFEPITCPLGGNRS